MNKFLSLFLIASMAVWCSQAIAQDTPSSKPAAAPKTAKKTPPKKAKEAVKAMIAQEDDDKEHDISGSTAKEFHCELGNKVTTYHNADDEQHIGMRWLKKIHRLTRVGTSTGANRFENSKAGLVWIGIPSKSMLLDSKKGNQLANECKTAEQMAPKKAIANDPPKSPEPAKQ